MFRRLSIVLALSLVALLLALPAQAQDSWFVLLYNSLDNELLRVNSDGVQESYRLELPPDGFVGPRDIAFSSDGERAGLCLIQYDPSGINTTTLTAQNLLSGGTLFTQDLGHTIGCRVTANADGSLYAVAYIRSYANDPAADPNISSWGVLVVDAATGEILHTLDAESAVSSVIAYEYGNTFLPYTLQFTGDEVTFGEVPYGTEFPPDYPVYNWNFAEETLEPAKETGNLFSAYLPSTGETAQLTLDESLPAGEPFGPMPRSNIVTVTDANGETNAVYHSPDWILSGVNFMDSGERLLLQLSEPFISASTQIVSQTRWIALDRQGNKTDIFTTDGFASLYVAPEGYLVFSTESDTLPAEYTLDYYGGGGVETLLTLTAEQYGLWEVAYVSPMMVETELPPFTPITP